MITLFKEANKPKPDKQLSLQQILNYIKTPSKEFINQIKALRKLPANQYQIEKKKLAGVTFGGEFSRRDKKHLIVASGYAILDYDKFPTLVDTEKKKKILFKHPAVLAVWLSPSYRGCKALLKIPVFKTSSEYSVFYKEYILEAFPDTDISNSDITRLCFLSHDANILMKDTAIEFNPTDKNAIKFQEYINKVGIYKKGNRNNFIRDLAGYCARGNIPQDYVEKQIRIRWKDNEGDNLDAVSSMYSRNEPAPSTPKMKSINIDAETPEELITFKDYNIFERLPEKMQEIINQYTNNNSRSMALMSLLGVYSNVFPNITFWDSQSPKLLHLNIMFYGIGKSGQGKGVLGDVTEAIESIETELEMRHEEAIDNWSEEQENQKVNKVKGHGFPKPIRQRFSIPANISSAQFHRYLFNASNGALVVDTEASTISANRGTEWGDTTALVRKAYHHEKIDFNRATTGIKGGQEEIIIKSPRLSFLITSTPRQAATFIGNVEDGSAARFLYLILTGYADFIIRNEYTEITNKMEALEDNLFEIWKVPLPEHTILLNNVDKIWIANHINILRELLGGLISSDLDGLVMRVYINMLRIAGILHMIENPIIPPVYFAKDKLILARDIVNVCLEHGIQVYKEFYKLKKEAEKLAAPDSERMNGKQSSTTQIVRAKYLDNPKFSPKELAIELGTSIGSIKVLKARIKKEFETDE